MQMSAGPHRQNAYSSCFQAEKEASHNKNRLHTIVYCNANKGDVGPFDFFFGRADDNCEHALDTPAEQKPLKLSSVGFCFVFAD